ncbi:MAG TPA: protein kinase [Gemmataceae bacterium]|nr:protein kinase [Gemmataceae bacterium]
MQVDCPQCGHVLEFSGERPSFCAYCGKPLSRPPLDATSPFDPDATRPAVTRAGGEVHEAPRSVGNYRLLRPLGGGGMGTVYEAEESGSHRHVALKLISPEYAASPDAVDRFRQEGRLASMIAHPRCVFVLAADEDAGQPYIVMELMSGSTLQELVDKRGPLPQEEAVARILDAIEGLQEAHRLGVIHRDVKPSNCFLLPDGRVKVGDFGLAKSLVTDSNLTKTGTFLGTLLYAPPEQIKGEDIDFRTDVYSVSATLYHLLTGRPPFQGKDPAATLARTVSERPPPPRRLRPELSPALEKIVLRGLERDRADRWRDLEELRQALLPFAPGRLVPAGIGARLGAFIIDFLLLLQLWAIFLILITGVPGKVPGDPRNLLLHLLEFLPFGLMEGRWGWTPGKRLLRLRVCGLTGVDPPGVARGLLRVLSFYGCIWGGAELLLLLYPGRTFTPELAMLGGALEVLGFLLVNSTLRARNGYRGLHELISGTRVVRLPWPEQRQLYRSRYADRLVQLPPCPAQLPARLGPYRLRGTLRQGAGESLLLGEDTALGRPVWLYLRPRAEGQVTTARRELNRPTRLPCLAGGEYAGQAWDAFLATAGCPLADLVDSKAPLSWGRLRPLLLQLADELVAACADDTLPAPLNVAQVWVQPNGRVQLLDVPIPGAIGADTDAPGETDSARALVLLRQVAALALEGRLQATAAGEPIHAPVPASVALLLDRLSGAEQPYEQIEQVQADLIAQQGEPTEVDTTLRSGHLALLVAVLVPVLVLMLGVRYFALHHALRDLYHHVTLEYTAVQQLQDEVESKKLFAGQQSSEVLRQKSPAQWRAAIEHRLTQDQQRWDGLRQIVRWDWLARFLVAEAYWRPDVNPITVVDFGPVHLERAAVRAIADADAEAAGPPLEAFVLILGPMFWCVLWAFATRGGWTFGLVGLSLRRANGRRALRIQCAWRALLFWAPVAVLLILSVWVQTRFPERPILAFALWCSAVGVLVSYMLLALWFPRRSLHDRLAGTYLVPQ